MTNLIKFGYNLLYFLLTFQKKFKGDNMCGRFALSATTKDIEKLQPGLVSKVDIKPRHNISPTQNIAVIRNDLQFTLDSAHWGLIPVWSKDTKIGIKMFNARAETIDEKASFNNAFQKRRCLIPATSFYEWKTISGQTKKQPYEIKLSKNDIFFFAGLWEIWYDEEKKPLLSTTIITTEPNEIISEIYNRMPVILDNDSIDLWLAKNSDSKELKEILKPRKSEDMSVEIADESIFKNRESYVVNKLSLF